MGRDDEITRLETVLSGVSGRAHVIEISGEAGAGKTRLLTDVALIASRHGWTVASSSADTAPTGLRFGAFADALDDLMAPFGTDLLQGFPHDHRRWLAGIFPALAAAAPGAGPGSPAEVYHAFRAIRSMLESLCAKVGGNGVLLVIDDAHWVDDTSRELLRQLVRRPPNAEFALVIAHRPRQADQSLRELLDERAAMGTAHRFDLAPLTEQDALALVPDGLGAHDRRALVRRAGGNPGRLRALISIMGGSGRDGPPDELPPGVMAWCLRDFRALSPLGLLVARSMAVTDETLRPELLMAVAEVTEPEIWTALDELVREDVLRAEDRSPRFRFRDPFLRAAAYQSAGAGWRLGAHSRAATALQAGEAPPTALADHLAHTAVEGDETSMWILLRAARACAWDRPDRTVSWARAALRLPGTGGEAAVCSRLLLGMALTVTGSFEEGLAVLEDLKHLDADTGLWSEAAVWRAHGMRLLGRHRVAIGQLRAALDALPARFRRRRSTLHLALFAATLEQGEALDTLDEAAVRRTCGSADRALSAYALALLAAGDAERGRTASASTRADQAARLAGTLADSKIVRQLETLWWLGRTEHRLGRHTAARAHLERGLELAERRSLNYLIPHFATELSALALHREDLGSASRHADRASEVARHVGSEFLLGRALALRKRIAEGDGTDSALAAVPAEAVTLEPSAETREALEQLSGREIEIAMLVSEGRTNQQIARALQLSHKTVETYLARIFKKLRVCSRAQVATLVGRSDRRTPASLAEAR